MAETNEPIFGFVRERDVDFMLVEEFTCSPAFQTWFLRFVLPDDQKASQITDVDVRQGVVESGDSPGETDLIIDFRLNSTVIRARVENKIDAVFQPDQVERYRGRAETDQNSGEYRGSLFVLLAPNEYIESAGTRAAMFSASLAYEQIIEFFQQQVEQASDELARRYRHKIEILEAAISKRHRGYSPDISQEVSAFWLAYWQKASEVASDLQMERPSGKPVGSSFVHFNQAIKSRRPLPDCKIKHKLRHGLVDLEIAGWADRLDEVSPAIQPLLEPSMQLRQAGKSLAVSISVPPVEIVAIFEEKRNAAEEGMAAALYLKDWFAKQHDALREIARQDT